MSDPVHPRRHSRARRLSWAVVAGAILVVAGLAYLIAVRPHQGAPPARAVASQRGPSSTAGQPGASISAPLAPNGSFTTASGATTTIASLRGRSTIVWFVAGGCASCAASIPTVAAHLRQLVGGVRTQVVTLGLYGAFPPGKAGVAQLLSFGRSAAGANVTRPGWTWGMASQALSLAYDPGGIPDIYVLIGPNGHVRYHNSVPVSTMPQLLAAAASLSGHTATGGSGAKTKTLSPTPSSTLP